jgi:hypothetical protein
MKNRILLASTFALSFVAAACGGEKQPAHSPDSVAGVTETSSTKEDMPPPPAKEVEAAAAPTPETASQAAAAPTAGGVIKLAAVKVTPAKKGKDKAVELKEDGSVTIGGKPAAKIKGDEVTSSGGTSMLTVGVDGSLVGNGVKPGFKFEGDDLVTEGGAKLSVADDGTVTVTKDGKSETIAKTDNGASAKRAALIATVLWLTLPPSVNAPAKKATGNGPTAVAKPAKN